MTNEEAREIFLNRGYIQVKGGRIYDGDKWRESVVVISKWLEQQPTAKENLVVEDCISRKALIEYANNLKDGIGITANDIARFPSIQPKAEWVPVSEGLPKDEQDVLIQYGNSIFVGYHKRDYAVYDPEFEDLDETGWYDEHDVFIVDSYSIDAWMPLPKLYKQDELERENKEYDR